MQKTKRFRMISCKTMGAFHNHSERLRAQCENVAFLNESLIHSEFNVHLDFADITYVTPSKKWAVRSIPRTRCLCSHSLHGSKSRGAA